MKCPLLGVLLCMGLALLPAASAEVKPINLPINTKADEDDPHIASNGLVLYYSAHTKDKWDILRTQRATVRQHWPLGKIPDDYVSTPGHDRSVFTTTEGRYPQYLYYSTTRDRENDNYDLFVAVRLTARSVFTSPTPLNTIATAADEKHPWLSPDGRTLYFSRKTDEGWRVLQTVREKAVGAAGFGEPKVLEQLPPGFHHPTLTPDGRTMYLQGPLEKGRWGLFRTVSTKQGWSKPEPLKELNNSESPKGEMSPCLSRDGRLLYFASDRAGGKGGLDLWYVLTNTLPESTPPED